MTTTPESWDDVGCLRLEVDCISQKVEDLHKELQTPRDTPRDKDVMTASDFQKLKAEVALIHEHNKQESCRRKGLTVVITIIAIVLALLCNAVLSYHYYAGSAPEGTPEILPEAHRSQASEVKTLLPPARAKKNSKKRLKKPTKKKPAWDAAAKRKEEESLVADQPLDKERWNQSIEETVSMSSTAQSKVTSVAKGEPVNRQPRKYKDEDIDDDWDTTDEEVKENMEDYSQKIAAQKLRTAGNLIAKKEPEPKQTHKPDLQRIPHPQSSINAEGRPTTHKPNLQSTRNPQSSDSINAEGRAQSLPIKAAQDITIPLAADKHEKKKGTFSHGLFWVCFPPRSLQRRVKRYARVFTEVANRQKLMIYPICYLDTRLLNMEGTLWTEHYCNDLDKITFVLQVERSKSGRVPVGNPVQSAFDDCARAFEKYGQMVDHDRTLWTQFESPAFFRQEVDPQEDIKAFVVEKFLNDAYYGVLPEYQTDPSKADL